ncbi:MAG: hypothetical protein WEA56_02375 [Balneolaceae bacterium]
MLKIGVYKTTIYNKSEASRITDLILDEIPDCDVSFDLEDCDKVLRIETSGPEAEEAAKGILEKSGHKIEPIPF